MNSLVVVVEDASKSLRLVSQILRWEGYRVLDANDAEIALHLILEYCPDIVVLDMDLSLMDGSSLVRLLRSNRRTDSLPIIALTAHAGKNEIQAAIEAGVTDYIPKPIDTSDFCQVVARYVPRPSGGFPLVGKEN